MQQHSQLTAVPSCATRPARQPWGECKPRNALAGPPPTGPRCVAPHPCPPAAPCPAPAAAGSRGRPRTRPPAARRAPRPPCPAARLHGAQGRLAVGAPASATPTQPASRPHAGRGQPPRRVAPVDGRIKELRWLAPGRRDRVSGARWDVFARPGAAPGCPAVHKVKHARSQGQQLTQHHRWQELAQHPLPAAHEGIQGRGRAAWRPCWQVASDAGVGHRRFRGLRNAWSPPLSSRAVSRASIGAAGLRPQHKSSPARQHQRQAPAALGTGSARRPPRTSTPATHTAALHQPSGGAPVPREEQRPKHQCPGLLGAPAARPGRPASGIGAVEARWTAIAPAQRGSVGRHLRTLLLEAVVSSGESGQLWVSQSHLDRGAQCGVGSRAEGLDKPVAGRCGRWRQRHAASAFELCGTSHWPQLTDSSISRPVAAQRAAPPGVGHGGGALCGRGAPCGGAVSAGAHPVAEAPDPPAGACCSSLAGRGSGCPWALSCSLVQHPGGGGRAAFTGCRALRLASSTTHNFFSKRAAPRQRAGTKCSPAYHCIGLDAGRHGQAGRQAQRQNMKHERGMHGSGKTGAAGACPTAGTHEHTQNAGNQRKAGVHTA